MALEGEAFYYHWLLKMFLKIHVTGRLKGPIIAGNLSSPSFPPEPWSKGEAFHPTKKTFRLTHDPYLLSKVDWKVKQTYHYDVDRTTFNILVHFLASDLYSQCQFNFEDSLKPIHHMHVIIHDMKFRKQVGIFGSKPGMIPSIFCKNYIASIPFGSQSWFWYFHLVPMALSFFAACVFSSCIFVFCDAIWSFDQICIISFCSAVQSGTSSILQGISRLFTGFSLVFCGAFFHGWKHIRQTLRRMHWKSWNFPQLPGIQPLFSFQGCTGENCKTSANFFTQMQGT